MFSIEIANEQQTLTIDERRLRQAIDAVLREAGLSRATISLAVVDDPTIHELNRQYLEHDYPTDVLSFVLERDGASLDGEVIVSADTAARMAGQFGWTAHDELLLYAIHGALHLVGYDDLDDAPRAQMRAAETRILKACGLEQPRRAETPPRAVQ
jgi:probable rRNA maturation factor